MFEINYSQLIQYEILEKLVTFIVGSRGASQLGGIRIPDYYSLVQNI